MKGSVRRTLHLPALLALAFLLALPRLAVPGDPKPRDERPGATSADKGDEKKAKDKKKAKPDEKKPRKEAYLRHTPRNLRRVLIRTLRASQRLAIRRLVRDRVRQRVRDRGTWALRWLVDGARE